MSLHATGFDQPRAVLFNRLVPSVQLGLDLPLFFELLLACLVDFIDILLGGADHLHEVFLFKLLLSLLLQRLAVSNDFLFL